MIKTSISFNVGGLCDISMQTLDFKRVTKFKGTHYYTEVVKVGNCSEFGAEFILRVRQPDNFQRGRPVIYNGLTVLSFTVEEVGDLDMTQHWQATLVRANKYGFMLFRVEEPWKEEDF